MHVLYIAFLEYFMNNIFKATPNNRIRLLQAAIIVVCSIFVMRLFYLQVIKYSFYQSEAQASQLKRYEIPAERGIVYAFDGSTQVPIVLNERRYTIVADPQIIQDKETTALRVADVLSTSKDAVLERLNQPTRYEILAKKQTRDIKDKIESMMLEGEIIGIFAERTNQRVYPHDSLAAQLLGYVNDDGEGRYGVEEALDDALSGTSGRVAALTDQNGIPLLATGDNIVDDPINGQDVALSIDVVMQRQLEIILKKGLDAARSDSGSALIMDPNTGAIKALANYPSYDPAKFSEVEDPSLFTNPTVSSPLEPGSIMKVLTTAAALDSGAVSPEQSYFDPSFFTIDDAVVRNVEEGGGPAQRSISDILRLSLNTGATWLLMQMGDGELNEKGRILWHEYMSTHYLLGQPTGIEQGYEEPGFLPSPVDGFGLNIQYANTSFGQGMSATPLQMASAVSAVINGGTYYKPTLIAGYSSADGTFEENQPEIIRQNVVSRDVSKTIVDFMQVVVANSSVTRPLVRDGYVIGGKTGTAEIARPEGGYFEDKFNGTYVGFVGGSKPDFVILIRVNDPGIPGYAGSQAAGPIFSDTVNMLIDNFSVISQ